jgi:tripartite-type tricarboxylate transporter receptor subunit TctC
MARTRLALPISAFMLTAAANPALAQPKAAPDAGYPSRPIRLVVPFTAGSTLDIMARVMGESLSSGLGQPVVTDNRPGANGIVGTQIVAKAPADGHVMLLATGSFTGNLVMVRKLSYTAADFAPISLIAQSFGLVLATHPGNPASVKELLAAARNRNAPLTYASSGYGNMTHVVGELMRTATNTPLTHVPFQGSAPALTAVLSRQVDMTFISTVAVQPYIREGKVRALALTGGRRAPVLPDIPTFRELGYADFEMTGWYGMWFPARTPAARVTRMSTEVQRAVKSAALGPRLEELGLVAEGTTPEAFARFLADDLALQQRIARQAGIQPQ